MTDLCIYNSNDVGLPYLRVKRARADEALEELLALERVV